MQNARTHLKKSTAYQQFQLLVMEMEKVPWVARGVSLIAGNRERVEKVWDGIAKKLNDLGPTVRPANEWRKVWSDLRARTKRKILEMEFNPMIRLTDVELIVNKLVTSHYLERETGNDGAIGKRMRRKRRHEDTFELLEQQVELQRMLVDTTEKRNLAAQRQVEALEKLVEVMQAQSKAIANISRNVIM